MRSGYFPFGLRFVILEKKSKDRLFPALGKPDVRYGGVGRTARMPAMYAGKEGEIMNYNEEALKVHAEHRGKIEIVSKVPVRTRGDLSTG